MTVRRRSEGAVPFLAVLTRLQKSEAKRRRNEKSSPTRNRTYSGFLGGREIRGLPSKAAAQNPASFAAILPRLTPNGPKSLRHGPPCPHRPERPS